MVWLPRWGCDGMIGSTQKLLMARAGVSAGATAEISYADYFGDSTDIPAFSSRTFTGRDIGTAGDKRFIAIACAIRNNGSIGTSYPTITVGGVATTRIVDEGTVTSNAYACMYITNSAIPSGTTANVVVTNVASVNTTRQQFFLYRFIPSGSSPSILATEFLEDNVNPMALNFDFSSSMTSASVGVHMSYSANTNTFPDATGDMVYSTATQIVDTSRVRTGIITNPGVYTVTATSTTQTLSGMAFVAE